MPNRSRKSNRRRRQFRGGDPAAAARATAWFSANANEYNNILGNRQTNRQAYDGALLRRGVAPNAGGFGSPWTTIPPPRRDAIGRLDEYQRCLGDIHQYNLDNPNNPARDPRECDFGGEGRAQDNRPEEYAEVGNMYDRFPVRTADDIENQYEAANAMFRRAPGAAEVPMANLPPGGGINLGGPPTQFPGGGNGGFTFSETPKDRFGFFGPRTEGGRRRTKRSRTRRFR